MIRQRSRKPKIPDDRPGVRSALICRGLTGSMSRPSSLDQLARALDGVGWTSFTFDYRYSLHSALTLNLRTTRSMVTDVSRAIASHSKSKGRLPDAIVARGTAARVALEALASYPQIPLVMWAPILWLRTSLELRYRLHEIRRTGQATFDDTTIGQRFAASLKDPTDKEMKSWVKSQRRHVIVQPKDDQVSPLRLAEEARDLIKAAKGDVELIVVPGQRPHPGGDVRDQISKIVKVISDLV